MAVIHFSIVRRQVAPQVKFLPDDQLGIFLGAALTRKFISASCLICSMNRFGSLVETLMKA